MRFRTVAVTVFSAVMMTAFATPARAQTIAVKGGINFTNISQDAKFSPDDQLKGITGFMAGVEFTRALTGMIDLQFEALFTQKGNRLVNTGDDLDNKIVINYIEIPVLARFGVMESGDTKVSVHVGPAFSFKASSTERNNGNDVDEPLKLKSMDMGLAIGGQAAINKLIIGARYTLGLMNIFGDDADNFGFTSLKNRAFTIFAGYSLK